MPGLFVVDRDSVKLSEQNLTVDAREFAALGKSSQEGNLERAVALFHPEFLADLAIDAEAFDTWRRREGANLAEIARRAFETLSQQHRPAP